MQPNLILIFAVFNHYSLQFSGQYNCAFCPFKISTLEAFKKHLDKWHSTCQGCRLEFYSFEETETHESFCLKSIKAKKAKREKRDQKLISIKAEVSDSDVFESESEIKICEITNEDFYDVYFNDAAEESFCDDQRNSNVNKNENQSAKKSVTLTVNMETHEIDDDENWDALQSIIGKFFPILQIEISNKFC